MAHLFALADEGLRDLAREVTYLGEIPGTLGDPYSPPDIEEVEGVGASQDIVGSGYHQAAIDR